MKAVSLEPVTVRPNRQEVVRAILVSDDTPDTLPTTGAGIEGMNGNQIFAPFSLLYVVADVSAKVYITDESGAFVAQ
jgi:hypothetical protein